MDIGKEQPKRIVEPVKEPVPKRRSAPPEPPPVVPDREPVRVGGGDEE